MWKTEHGVCVDKKFDWAGSKCTCGKSLLVKIQAEVSPNFYTVLLQQKPTNLEFGFCSIWNGKL